MPGIKAKLDATRMEECGLSLAEIGRQLGVNTSAVSKAIRKRQRSNSMQSTTSRVSQPLFMLSST
jgi:predicted transcriptional regulator